MAYSIASALESELFDKVVVSTDSSMYAEIARSYGASVIMRPERLALATSPDYGWVDHIMRELWENSLTRPNYYAILRPTSPFRSAETIKRCWDEWDRDKYQSIRAVEPVRQHPGKMWMLRGDTIYPLLSLGPTDPPWHSSQVKTLPMVYVQNASLEMARTKILWKTKTISGWRIQGFQTRLWEGHDINDQIDWGLAEELIDTGKATLPEIQKT